MFSMCLNYPTNGFVNVSSDAHGLRSTIITFESAFLCTVHYYHDILYQTTIKSPNGSVHSAVHFAPTPSSLSLTPPPPDPPQEFAKQRRPRSTLNTPLPSVPTKQPPTLQVGEKQNHPGHIPDHLPAFPDSHAYVQTPTHKQPITNYEAVREKAASQKRDMERALTRFIAKTGPVDKLFDSDEQAQFPRE